jgi:hypothetical protein
LLLASRGASVVVNDLGVPMAGAGQSKGPAEHVVQEIIAAGGKGQLGQDRDRAAAAGWLADCPSIPVSSLSCAPHARVSAAFCLLWTAVANYDNVLDGDKIVAAAWPLSVASTSLSTMRASCATYRSSR